MAIIYKIFSSETRRDNEFLFCRNDVWEVLYKISIFRADRTANMAAIENKHVHHGIFFGFFFILLPTKLRRDIVMLPSVRPSVTSL